MALKTRIKLLQASSRFSMSAANFHEDLNRIAEKNADIIVVTEAAGRRKTIAIWARSVGYRIYHPYEAHTQRGDVAIIWNPIRFDLVMAGSKQMHDDPPGRPTARYTNWVILWDKYSNRPIRVLGKHTLAAVERAGKLNPIRRTKYYVQDIAGVIRLDLSVARIAKNKVKHRGQGVLMGDLNWGDQPGSWLRKMLSPYYTSNYETLGRPNKGTLGKRCVDYVMKHGRAIKFVEQEVFNQNADHNGLLVTATVTVR